MHSSYSGDMFKLLGLNPKPTKGYITEQLEQITIRAKQMAKHSSYNIVLLENNNKNS